VLHPPAIKLHYSQNDNLAKGFNRIQEFPGDTGYVNNVNQFRNCITWPGSTGFTLCFLHLEGYKKSKL